MNNKEINKLKARFFEAQWLDLIRKNGINDKLISNYRTVPDEFIHSNHHQEMAKLLSCALNSVQQQPVSMLEVGPSLGRSCFESIKTINSLEKVCLIEPSTLFFDDLRNLLDGGKTMSMFYVKGISEYGAIEFDPSFITDACKHIQFSFLNTNFTTQVCPDNYDLVVCLNVLDQCSHPTRMVMDLKNKVKPMGIIQLSCTYQWQRDRIADDDQSIADINDCFDNTHWNKLSETESNYSLRMHERFTHTFLSHSVIYQKLN